MRKETTQSINHRARPQFKPDGLLKPQQWQADAVQTTDTRQFKDLMIDCYSDKDKTNGE